MSHPLSVQLYTVRAEIAEDRDGVLRQLADLGFGAVEPFQPTEDPVGFRKVADDLGLVVSSAHAMGLLDAEPGPVFEAIADARHRSRDRARRDPAGGLRLARGLERAADLLNALSAKATAHGLRLGYHNHWWEFEPVHRRQARPRSARRAARPRGLPGDRHVLGGRRRRGRAEPCCATSARASNSCT